MRVSARKLLLGSPHALALVLASPALAQTYELPVPPVKSNVDARSVDLSSGGVAISDPQLSIGTSQNGLSFVRYWPGLDGWRHNYMVSAKVDAYGRLIVSNGSGSVSFTYTDSGWVSDANDGTKLVETPNTYTMTDRTGSVIVLDRSLAQEDASYYGSIVALGTKITSPNGFTTSSTYKSASYTYLLGMYNFTANLNRLQSVRTSTGYQLKFTYASNTLSQATANDWMRIKSVQAINNAVDYCDPAADVCGGFTKPWPSVSFATTASGTDSIEAVTDPVGRVRRYVTNSAGKLTAIRRPAMSNYTTNTSTNNVSYAYDANGRVSSVSVLDAGVWNYSFTDGTGTLTATVTTPTVPTPRTVVTDTALLLPKTDTDENGRTTTYEWCPTGTSNCASGQLTKVTKPEGNYFTFAYDGRGNRTLTKAYPKAGSGLTVLTTSAAYPSTCANTKTCNQPTSTTDTAGNVTNYYYNADGSLDYVQAPPPWPGGVRPETHYSYYQFYSWVKWNSNSVTMQPDLVTYPKGTTTCITGSWPCAASAQKVTDIGYPGGPSATNVQASVYTTKRGDGTESASVSFVRDEFGNITWVTDPNGQGWNTSYAADRQVLTKSTPSLDGTTRRITILHYNGNGQWDSTSYGTVNLDGSNFIPMQRILPLYDNAGREITERLVNGAMDTTYSVKQWSYSAAGRLECETLRMNSADFASPPAACTQGTGGADRINWYTYEYAGLVHEIWSGVNTSLQRKVMLERTSNDVVNRMVDQRGKVTSYAIDGFDRPIRECYNADTGACQGNTATDFVQLTYDSVGRLSARSLRGHPTTITIGYAYDNLGRVTNVNYPGGSDWDAPVSYSYDNLGQMLQASDTKGHYVTYGYDALGRVTSQGNGYSNLTMQYDAAGNRTRLTWPDNKYVTYEYDPVGEMTAIKESGSASLASFTYDGMGRRTRLTRGNGVTTNYDYDPASRLTCLRLDLAGSSAPSCNPTASGQDQASKFTYNAAGQITSRTTANDAYTFTARYNVNRGYTANSLNQYTQSGSVTPTYDVKGNLASAGGTPTYAYSTKNELIVRTDTKANFYHDPIGRLETVTSSPTGDYGFHYVDNHISDEYSMASGSPMLRRYVYGPGDDEPLVWYEGTDFSNKRYLVADERGSVVAVTDTAGTAVAINSYDEYGIPGGSNRGRFQYTGQAWLSELGMYSYKARIYSPTMGRFLQTDPAGYPDGPNWYNYVGADPINRVDPSGMRCGGTGIESSYCNPYYPDDDGPPIYVGAVDGGGIDYFPPSGGSIDTFWRDEIYEAWAFDNWIANKMAQEPKLKPQKVDPCNPGVADSFFENGLDALGLVGDGLAVAGAVTGNPVLLGVGEGLNVVSTLGSVALDISQGDTVGLAFDGASFAAGLVPGARLARRFGGAGFDLGRRANGQFARNWRGLQKAQDIGTAGLQSQAAGKTLDAARCSR